MYDVYALEDHPPYCLMVSSGQPASVAAAFLKLCRDMHDTRLCSPSSMRSSLRTRARKVVGTGRQLDGNMKSGSFDVIVGVSLSTTRMAATGQKRGSLAAAISTCRY